MRLLIVAGQTLADGQPAPAGPATLVAAASEILVISPSLVGPLHWLTGDVDHARYEANDRLAAAVHRLENAGTPVEGQQVDELLPAAFDDAIRTFHPDHIIIVAKKDDHRWERHNILARLLDNYELAVTIFAADGPRAS
jgi:hypothetical protein